MSVDTRRAVTLQGLRAGFVSRASAAAIDVALVYATFLLILGAYAVAAYLLTDDPLELPDPGAVWSGTGFTVLLVVVLTVAWSGPGRTIGDVAVGLRVVTDTGGDLRWPRALVRAVVVVGLPFLSMGWIVVSRKNAGWHDLVARTTVVYDWRPRSRETRPRE
jgi:uncharacterized RDD family membrane protein YckC